MITVNVEIDEDRVHRELVEKLAAMKAALVSSRKWLTNFHYQVGSTIVGQELRTLITEIDTLLGDREGEEKDR